ncbi:MAG TPA: hypothetical protein VGI50_09920 [Solirubrobacteraceae bacterium]
MKIAKAAQPAARRIVSASALVELQIHNLFGQRFGQVHQRALLLLGEAFQRALYGLAAACQNPARRSAARGSQRQGDGAAVVSMGGATHMAVGDETVDQPDGR